MQLQHQGSRRGDRRTPPQSNDTARSPLDGLWILLVDNEGQFTVSDADGRVPMMAVDVDAAAGALRLGVPKPIFEGTVSTVTHTQPIFTYAVTPDGQRVLVSRVPGEDGSEVDTPLTVVVNWDVALKR